MLCLYTKISCTHSLSDEHSVNSSLAAYTTLITQISNGKFDMILISFVIFTPLHRISTNPNFSSNVGLYGRAGPNLFVLMHCLFKKPIVCSKVWYWIFTTTFDHVICSPDKLINWLRAWLDCLNSCWETKLINWIWLKMSKSLWDNIPIWIQI